MDIDTWTKSKWKINNFLRVFRGQGKYTDPISKLLMFGLMRQLELVCPEAEQKCILTEAISNAVEASDVEIKHNKSAVHACLLEVLSCQTVAKSRQEAGSESGLLWNRWRNIEACSLMVERELRGVEHHPYPPWWSFLRAKKGRHWFLWMWNYCWRSRPNMSVENSQHCNSIESLKDKNQKPQPWSCFIHNSWLLWLYMYKMARPSQHNILFSAKKWRMLFPSLACISAGGAALTRKLLNLTSWIID